MQASGSAAGVAAAGRSTDRSRGLASESGVVAFQSAAKMAKEPQEDLDLELGDDEEDQQQRSGAATAAGSRKPNSQEPVIPNFRGKVPDAELPERKGPVQVSSHVFSFVSHAQLIHLQT